MVTRQHISPKKLFSQLESCRQRIAELEAENRRLMQSEQERARLEYHLQERVKELNCLYGMAEQIERYGTDLDRILQGIVDLLPPSWQYPAHTCARIVFEGHAFRTAGFRETGWRQAADIRTGRTMLGTVEVFYLQQMPAIYEGPFLQEERFLIDAVAERIGRVSERIRTELQLQTEKKSLSNMNIALKEVLGKLQDEKQELAATIQGNIDKIVMPIVHALAQGVRREQQGYIELLEKNLQEITDPFINKTSRSYLKLTPSELQICNMIRSGLSTKEIARLRHLSPATVNRHRDNIRKKLGISRKGINLCTYLNRFADGLA